MSLRFANDDQSIAEQSTNKMRFVCLLALQSCSRDNYNFWWLFLVLLLLLLLLLFLFLLETPPEMYANRSILFMENRKQICLRLITKRWVACQWIRTSCHRCILSTVRRMSEQNRHSKKANRARAKPNNRTMEMMELSSPSIGKSTKQSHTLWCRGHIHPWATSNMKRKKQKKAREKWRVSYTFSISTVHAIRCVKCDPSKFFFVGSFLQRIPRNFTQTG